MAWNISSLFPFLALNFGHTDSEFPSTNCPYRGVKATCFGKSVKVLTGDLFLFYISIKSLQNNVYNAIVILNLMKI